MNKYLLKTVIIAVITFINFPSSYAQTVLWAKKGISEGFENGNAIAVDDSGNVYCTGQLEFTSVFDNYSLNSYGQHDILLVKYGPDGTIKWIRQAGGKGGDIGNGIGIDAAHNVYITGEIEDSAKFGNIKLASAGANDGFVAKYDVSGNIVWAKVFGAPIGSDKGRAMAVSPSGDIYITGNFTYNTSFGSFTLSTSGGNDMFVVKMSTNGDFIWAKKAGGNSQDRGYGIAIDASDNVYVTGTFTQSATFKNTTITNSGNHSTFLAKYDSNGSFQWVTAGGDCCDTTKANSIALDDSGNIYLAGYFMDHTKFGSYQFTSQGMSDVYVVKYDPNGNVVWAKQGGGIDEDGAYGIAVDNSNQRVYVTGLVRENGNFNALPFSIVGYKDIFITAYDLDGNEMWLKTYGGHYRDVGNAIAVDPLGYIYNTGLFNDNAFFGPYTLTGYPNQPWADFYVDKIQPPMAPMVTNQATDLTLTSAHCSDLKLSLTPGSGNKRIIVAREGAAVNAIPLNGNTYSGNSAFGNGSNLGNGNYVVYNGSGSGVTVSGLAAGETYYFSVFEYNGAGVSTNYLTSPTASISSMAAIFQITVNGLQNAICAGDSLVLHAIEATNIMWTPDNSLSSGIGSIVTAKPTTTTTYEVIGITTDGCDAHAMFTINVNPLPVVTLSTVNPLCGNSSSMMLTNGSPAGGVYSGTGINSGMFDPAMSGTGTFPVMYEFTDANGCMSNAQSNIVVNPVPVITMSPLPVLCRNGAPVTLNCASPAGGTYSGNGVSAGKFNPTIGVGNHVINYSYTDMNGCTSVASITATVEPLPNVNLGNDRIVCAHESTTLNAGNGFSSYSWSTGATTSSITVDSSGHGLGMNQFYCIVSSAAGCQSSATVQVTFDICSGINNTFPGIQDVIIYPNPFRNSFTISSEKQVSFSIYDMCGRLLDRRENVNGNILAGENFSRGVYYVEVISGATKKIFSVVKTE